MTFENIKLKVKFGNKPLNYETIFPNSVAVLAISVGQAYHEGNILIKTIQLINHTKFKKILIILGDTLQRHNLLIDDHDEQLAHIEAAKLGDEWLERNKPIYSKLEIPYKIIRWDVWLKHPLYRECRKQVDDLYRIDDSFRMACLKSVDQFIERHQSKSQISSKYCPELCLEYLLEECAIIMPLWAKELYNFIIYPSRMPDGMMATYNALVKPYYPANILNWLPLRCKYKCPPN